LVEGGIVTQIIEFTYDRNILYITKYTFIKIKINPWLTFNQT